MMRTPETLFGVTPSPVLATAAAAAAAPIMGGAVESQDRRGAHVGGRFRTSEHKTSGSLRVAAVAEHGDELV